LPTIKSEMDLAVAKIKWEQDLAVAKIKWEQDLAVAQVKAERLRIEGELLKQDYQRHLQVVTCDHQGPFHDARARRCVPSFQYMPH
jgi:hypothetical protein